MAFADATTVLTVLVRTTLAMGAGAILMQIAVWLAKPQSPRVHRMAWMCVLAIGWLWFRVPVTLPYYETVEPSTPAASERLPEVAERVAPPLRDADASKQVPFVSELAAGDRKTTPTEAMETSTLPAALPSWPGMLLGLWFSGMVAMVCGWLAGYVWFVWRLPSPIDGPAEWHDQWRQLLAQRGMSRLIPLHVTNRLGPMLCRLPSGYRLVVPAELWARLSPAGRLSVLRHELAHLRRGDVWKSLVMPKEKKRRRLSLPLALVARRRRERPTSRAVWLPGNPSATMARALSNGARSGGRN